MEAQFAYSLRGNDTSYAGIYSNHKSIKLFWSILDKCWAVEIKGVECGFDSFSDALDYCEENDPTSKKLGLSLFLHRKAVKMLKLKEPAEYKKLMKMRKLEV